MRQPFRPLALPEVDPKLAGHWPFAVLAGQLPTSRSVTGQTGGVASQGVDVPVSVIYIAASRKKNAMWPRRRPQRKRAVTSSREKECIFIGTMDCWLGSRDEELKVTTDLGKTIEQPLELPGD